jgi:hypothetical protein
MDGNLVVVGTGSELADANAAYVFVMENIDSSSSSWSSAWTQTAKLTGLTDSRFGVSVAVAENWIVVGANGDNNRNGNDAGSVFVFTKMASSSSST